MNPRTKRRRSRETAMQTLFQFDQNRDLDPVAAREFVAEQLHEEPLIEFAGQLIRGVQEHFQEIDSLLAQFARNWSIERMAPVDRSILRIAIYEIEYTETPPGVAINEALEVAKRFSTTDSAQFINGILDRVANRRRSEAQTPRGSEPAEEPADA